MCGLVGFSGYKSGDKKQKFNLGDVKLLLLQNSVDRSSTDGVGIYTKSKNNDIHKTTLSISTFFGSVLDIKPSSVLIGHVRNKSGNSSISKDNTHPFRVDNIVGAHNGHITNIETVCKKYDVDFLASKTDSLNFFRCLAKSNSVHPIVDAEGACTILFTDLNIPDRLYVYRKGRELFYGSKSEGLYLSSSRQALQLINCDKIEAFKEYGFYSIEDGEIKLEFELEASYYSSTAPALVSLEYRWLQAKENYGRLIKDEWYFCRAQQSRYEHDTTNWIKFLTISKGKFQHIHNAKIEVIKSDSENLEVPHHKFIMDEDLQYSAVSKKNPKLMIVVIPITLDTKEVINIGEYFIVDDYWETAKHFDGIRVSTETKIVRLPQEKLRICSQEEKTDFLQCLNLADFENNTVYSDLKKKLSPKFDIHLKNKEVVNFIKIIKSDIESLLAQFEQDADRDKIIKTTQILDEIEQFGGPNLNKD